MTAYRELIERLERAFVTASNDDWSRPGTFKRERHCQRLEAILDARDALRALEAQSKDKEEGEACAR